MNTNSGNSENISLIAVVPVTVCKETWISKCSDLMLTFVNAFSIFISNWDVEYLLGIKSHRSQCTIHQSECGRY